MSLKRVFAPGALGRSSAQALTGKMSTSALAIGLSLMAFPSHAVAASGQSAPQTSRPDTAVEPATGQASPEDTGAPDNKESDVVVTGSRVIRDGTQAPTPVTVVSGEQLALAAPGPIGEALNQLPAFRGSFRPTTGGIAATGPLSGSFLNLRNQGLNRTLILLDGRRVVPSALSGATDTNLLPQELVKRVDVVTGGASAAYGSDAVAGVVNFVLDTTYQGLKGEVRGGISNYGDDASFAANLTGGTSFAGGRGHVVFSGSHFDSDGVPSLYARPWGAEGRGIITNPANAAALIITTNVNSSFSSGGLITASPATATARANLLAGTQFAPGGTPVPYSFGTLASTFNQVGGDGARITSNIAAKVRTNSLFGHASYEVASGIEVFGEVAWAQAHNRYVQLQSSQLPLLSTLTIFSGNPFLPASLQTTLTQNSIPSFTLARVNLDFRAAEADTRNDTVNVVGGFNASLSSTWKLNGYVEVGRTTARTQTVNNTVVERLFAAADAVRAPDGSTVCRVTLTNPGLYPGCVPINFLGNGSPSQAGIDYALGTSEYVVRLKRRVAGVSVSGDLFNLPAGAVALGAGVEFRRDSTVQTSDPLSQTRPTGTGIRGFPARYLTQAGSYGLTNAQPVSGSIDVREGFAELLVPVLKDSPIGRSLDLNGAVRYADYSSTGGATTWKLGAIYQPLDGLRLRATRSRDIRSPNVSELFAGSIQSQGAVIDRLNNNATAIATTSAVGNPDLRPERADTLVAGVVYQPSWLPGAAASVDYYQIKINDVIGVLTAQQTIDQCAAGSAVACANIIRTSTGTISRVISSQLNLSSADTRGIDFELSYRTALGGSGQSLSFRSIFSNLRKQSTLPPGGFAVDRAGEVGGLTTNPRWSGTANVTYEHPSFVLFAQERFISAGKYDVTRVEGVTINDNSVPAVFYTDLTARFRIQAGGRRMELGLTVNNLFNRAPPNTPFGTAGIFLPTNIYLYDNVGRFFTGSLRFAL